MDENQPRVLVVEDQEAVRNMLGRLLVKSGLRVELAASGEHALLLLKREHDFAGIVADLLMPGLHGVALLKLIRELEPTLPLVVLTGSEIMESALVAAGCSVSRYLRKPLETSRLPEVVLALLAEARAAEGRSAKA